MQRGGNTRAQRTQGCRGAEIPGCRGEGEHGDAGGAEARGFHGARTRGRRGRSRVAAGALARRGRPWVRRRLLRAVLATPWVKHRSICGPYLRSGTFPGWSFQKLST